MKKIRTSQVRIRSDLAEKLSAIAMFGGFENIPQILDPLIRAEIESRYSKLSEQDRRAAKRQKETRRRSAREHS